MNEQIINKLFNNQLKNIDQKYCLNAKDIIRLASYIKTDPFSETECCKWRGAISKSSHNSKYINFWFNKKKQALHRILYLNYKGDLPKNKYLKFICTNQNMKGICCNINHIVTINDDLENENMPQLNMSQLNMSQLNMSQLNMPQLNMSQLNMPQLNMPQLNMPQLNMPQLNSLSKTNKTKNKKQDDKNKIDNNLSITIIENNFNNNRFIIVFED